MSSKQLAGLFVFLVTVIASCTDPSSESTCDDDGYYYPGAVPTYDLANTYGAVTLTVIIVQDPAQGVAVS